MAISEEPIKGGKGEGMNNPYKEHVIELTRRLIQCPSINPPCDTSDCAKIVLSEFKKNGINAEIVAGKEGACNVVARLPGEKKGKILLLNGHLDVVPPGEGWTVDPFGGQVQAGKIYGRGATDMKSGVASMIAAMVEIKRSAVYFNGEIVFMGVADEETGSEWGTQYLLKNKIGTNADFAIVGEPTNLRVDRGNRGVRWIDIVVRGKASHACRPHLGINAISYAARLAEAIHSIELKNRNDIFEVPTPSFSVTMIRGGTKENIIPNRCELVVDRRLLPGETVEAIMEALKRIIDPMMEREKGLEIEVRLRPNHYDPYLIPQDEPIVQATIESFEKVIGEKAKIGAKAGSTDGSHLFLEGIPAVIFGPGNPHFAHAVDECVDIEDIVLSTEILISIVDKLLK